MPDGALKIPTSWCACFMPACGAKTAGSPPVSCTCGMRRMIVRNWPQTNRGLTRCCAAIACAPCAACPGFGMMTRSTLPLRAARRVRAQFRAHHCGEAMKPIALPRDARVLIVALRRLGDVLLTTPLIRSVKRAFPAASIEVLVFAGTEGILANNPDVATHCDPVGARQRLETLALLWRLARRYDLALSTQTGDRPTLLAWIAGRQSAGPREADGFPAAVKRFALSRSCVSGPASASCSREPAPCRTCSAFPRTPRLFAPAGDVRADLVPQYPYAVVHAAPMFTYKRWTVRWLAHARARRLRERGLRTLVSGGNGRSRLSR